MKRIPEKVERYGKEVWENITLDALRKGECLCLNCAHLSRCPVKSSYREEGSPEPLSAAAALYKLCCDTGMAMAITRCPAWMPSATLPLT